MANHFFKTVDQAVKYWYMPLIAGLIFMGVGFWTFTAPLESYMALAMIFTISFIISGITEILFAITNRKEMDNWVWMLIFGVFTLVVGMLLSLNPLLSMSTLPLYAGFVVLFRSVGAITMALDIKNYNVSGWWQMLVSGILGVIFSFIMLWNPVIAGLTLVIWTGLSFIACGIFSIIFSLTLKNLHKLPENIPTELKDQYQAVKSQVQNELTQASK